MLASGRYAMLDDGFGFGLVSWRPVIEQWPGQQVAATAYGNHISWSIERLRMRSLVSCIQVMPFLLWHVRTIVHVT